MKTLIAFAIGLAVLAASGCAIVPAGPGPYGYYAAPAPAVVVAPVWRGGYYYRRW